LFPESRRVRGPRARFESLDLVQDGVPQRLQQGPRLAPANRTQFRSLLAKVLLYVVRDRLEQLHAAQRNAQGEQPLPSEGVSQVVDAGRPPTLPESALQRAEKRAWVRLGLELLQPEEREVIELRQFEKLTFEEVARHLGLSREDAARMRFKRAIASLSVCLQKARSAVQVDLGL